MSTGRVTGVNNYAGALVPQQSPWGQALALGTYQLIDQPEPIGHQNDRAFHGTVGGISTRSANVRVLFAPDGYYGDLPQTEQGTVQAAPPWDRP
jgi:hypothetical protein